MTNDNYRREMARDVISQFLGWTTGHAQDEVARLNDREVDELIAIRGKPEAGPERVPRVDKRAWVKDVLNRAYDRRQAADQHAAAKVTATADNAGELSIGVTDAEVDAVNDIESEAEETAAEEDAAAEEAADERPDDRREDEEPSEEGDQPAA